MGNLPASEACPDLADVNFAELVGWGELEGHVYGPRVAKKPVRLFGYLDLACVSVASPVANRVADDLVRFKVRYDLLSIHSNLQITLIRGECGAVVRFPLCLSVLGIAQPRSYQHGISRSELPAWEIWLSQQGITIELRKTWKYGGEALYFRDPDGHLLEVVTPGVWSIF